jgi:hypothetical protein
MYNNEIACTILLTAEAMKQSVVFSPVTVKTILLPGALGLALLELDDPVHRGREPTKPPKIQGYEHRKHHGARHVDRPADHQDLAEHAVVLHVLVISSSCCCFCCRELHPVAVPAPAPVSHLPGARRQRLVLTHAVVGRRGDTGVALYVERAVARGVARAPRHALPQRHVGQRRRRRRGPEHRGDGPQVDHTRLAAGPVAEGVAGARRRPVGVRDEVLAFPGG